MSPKVPGTFKARPGVLIVARNQEAAQRIVRMGAIYARYYVLGECTVLVGREPTNPFTGETTRYRWHLSIAHQSRYPTWDEIKTARYLAPELKDVKLMAQLLPKLADEDDWVDVHKNAMHLHEVIDEEAGT